MPQFFHSDKAKLCLRIFQNFSEFQNHKANDHGSPFKRKNKPKPWIIGYRLRKVDSSPTNQNQKPLEESIKPIVKALDLSQKVELKHDSVIKNQNIDLKKSIETSIKCVYLTDESKPCGFIFYNKSVYLAHVLDFHQEIDQIFKVSDQEKPPETDANKTDLKDYSKLSKTLLDLENRFQIQNPLKMADEMDDDLGLSTEEIQQSLQQSVEQVLETAVWDEAKVAGWINEITDLQNKQNSHKFWETLEQNYQNFLSSNKLSPKQVDQSKNGNIIEVAGPIKMQLSQKPDNQVPAVPPIPKPVVSLVIEDQPEKEPDPLQSKDNSDQYKLQELMKINEIFKMEINYNIFTQSHCGL